MSAGTLSDKMGRPLGVKMVVKLAPTVEVSSDMKTVKVMLWENAYMARYSRRNLWLPGEDSCSIDDTGWPTYNPFGDECFMPFLYNHHSCACESILIL